MKRVVWGAAAPQGMKDIFEEPLQGPFTKVLARRATKQASVETTGASTAVGTKEQATKKFSEEGCYGKAPLKMAI